MNLNPSDIRNLVLLGHSGAGKTSLAEALLHQAQAIPRLGSIQEANTQSDFEPEARLHRHSTSANLLFATRPGRLLNLIDTPGYPDFIGQALAVLPAVESALLVINAQTGLDNQSRKLFLAAGEAGLSRLIVINKIDLLESPQRLPDLVKTLQNAFGPELHCMNLPTRAAHDVLDCFEQADGLPDFGDLAAIHREIVESVVELDDTQMEHYLAGETLDLTELRDAFVKALNAGHVVPILFTSATTGVGIENLLHILWEDLPSPALARPKRLISEDAPQKPLEIRPQIQAPLLAHAFKVTTDPYVGKLVMLRILQGKLDPETLLSWGNQKKSRKAGHILKIRGKDHPEISGAVAGDLVALAKFDDLHAGEILHGPDAIDDLHPLPMRYPTPMFALAIEPKAHSDEARISMALTKLAEEDPTFQISHDTQTHELVIHGLGDLHLRIMLEKLTHRFGLEVTTHPPKIAYRESISAPAEGHYRHKKQSGGAGQFGEVFLRIEPLPRGSGYEFVNQVYGGAIPAVFIPAVEKGVQDLLTAGPLAGYPIQDVRVIVYDGKSHPVDSKEIAFRLAGKYAFQDAIEKARPILLEPVVNLEISAPEPFVGEITGDLNARRGRILGIDPVSGGLCQIHAQAPLSELAHYTSQLRSITSGAGSFLMDLAHYDPLPPAAQARIMESSKTRSASLSS